MEQNKVKQRTNKKINTKVKNPKLKPYKMLKDFEFGYADAETELLRVPEIFSDAYLDVENIADLIVNKYTNIVIGRKGVGKSAVICRLKAIDFDKYTIHLNTVKLSDFDYASIDIKYKNSFLQCWKFLLLLELFNLCINELDISDHDAVDKLKLALVQNDFLDKDLKSTFTTSKIDLSFNIAIFKFKTIFERNKKPSKAKENIITNLIIDLQNFFKTLYLNDRKLFLMIDGLDDVLCNEPIKLEIISTLIRACNELNMLFESNKLSVKIVTLVRKDIIKRLNHPDINKIIRDNSIELNWEDKLDELKQLVNLRFKLSDKDLDNANSVDYWDQMFPVRYNRSISSWMFITGFTLCRPRDILAFLSTCKSIYPNNTQLSHKEIENVLKKYSSDYFIQELRNELIGFVEEQVISNIHTVFVTLGFGTYSFEQFCNAFMSVFGSNYNIKKITTIAEILFESSFIGNFIGSVPDTSESIVFKYRNPNAIINYNFEFKTHKAITKGLGIAK